MTAPAATWLSVAEVAARAGISQRSVQLAVRASERGRSWRGCRLVVRRTVRQTGGGAGGATYEIREDSLPADLCRAIPALVDSPPPPAVAGTGTSIMVDDAAPLPLPPAEPGHAGCVDGRYAIVRPALEHPGGSRERARAIADIARAAGTAPSTLRSWIRAYDEQGRRGLRRRVRADKGCRKYPIGRAWAEAVGPHLAGEAIAAIAAAATLHIRSLWAGNARYGAGTVRRLASARLEDLTAAALAAAGVELDRRALRAACKMPERMVRKERRKYRNLAHFEQDRKTWSDTSRPRIRRTIEGLAPMDVVVADVHHLDILLPREDGSTYTPKLIVFMDLATGRLSWSPVFLSKGQAVRQEHVIEAFCAMAADPRWGVPSILYCDRGSEFGWVDLIDDAMRLNIQVRHCDDSGTADHFRQRASAVVRSLPYNAAAKGMLEGAFGKLEGGALSMIRGHIGGDRMNQPTANLGRKPTPFPGGEAEFRRVVALAMAWYDTQPQHGALTGRSPRQVFAEFVEAGWQPTVMELAELRIVLSRPVTRTVRQGAFKFKRALYTAEALWGVAAGTRATVLVPLVGGHDSLAVRDEQGKFLCWAERERPFFPIDREGTAERSRRDRVAAAAMRDLRKETPRVDPEQLMADAVAREDPAPTPEIGHVIRVSDDIEKIARAGAASPEDRRKAAEAEYERRRAEDLANWRNFKRKIGAGG